MSTNESSIERILGLDFETANPSRTSVCSLGLCLVNFSSGEVIDKKQFLINPHDTFHPRNIQTHGIVPDMVENSPCFEDVVDEIFSRLDAHTVLVAHNASFDIDVLCKTCKAHAIPIPELNFFCTYVLAKALFPDLTCYKLPVVASQCELPPFHHHLADDDAEICAEVFYSFAHMCSASTLQELEKNSGVNVGHINSDYSHDTCYKYHPSHFSRQYSFEKKLSTKDVDTTALSANPNHLLFGKNVVFSGAVQGISREKATSIVQSIGGLVEERVTKRTNYVISGIQDPTALRGHEKSSKIMKAERYIGEGLDIHILSEEDFRNLIS